MGPIIQNISNMQQTSMMIKILTFYFLTSLVFSSNVAALGEAEIISTSYLAETYTTAEVELEKADVSLKNSGGMLEIPIVAGFVIGVLLTTVGFLLYRLLKGRDCSKFGMTKASDREYTTLDV